MMLITLHSREEKPRNPGQLQSYTGYSKSSAKPRLCVPARHYETRLCMPKVRQKIDGVPEIVKRRVTKVAMKLPVRLNVAVNFRVVGLWMKTVVDRQLPINHCCKPIYCIGAKVTVKIIEDDGVQFPVLSVSIPTQLVGQGILLAGYPSYCYGYLVFLTTMEDLVQNLQ